MITDSMGFFFTPSLSTMGCSSPNVRFHSTSRNFTFRKCFSFTRPRKPGGDVASAQYSIQGYTPTLPPRHYPITPFSVTLQPFHPLLSCHYPITPLPYYSPCPANGWQVAENQISSVRSYAAGAVVSGKTETLTLRPSLGRHVACGHKLEAWLNKH